MCDLAACLHGRLRRTSQTLTCHAVSCCGVCCCAPAAGCLLLRHLLSSSTCPPLLIDTHMSCCAVPCCGVLLCPCRVFAAEASAVIQHLPSLADEGAGFFEAASAGNVAVDVDGMEAEEAGGLSLFESACV